VLRALRACSTPGRQRNGTGDHNPVSKLDRNAAAEAGSRRAGFRLWNPWFDVNGPLNGAGSPPPPKERTPSPPPRCSPTGRFEGRCDYVDVIEHQRYSLNPTLTRDDREASVLTIQGRFLLAVAAHATCGLPGAGTVIVPPLRSDPTCFPAIHASPKTPSDYDA